MFGSEDMQRRGIVFTSDSRLRKATMVASDGSRQGRIQAGSGPFRALDAMLAIALMVLLFASVAAAERLTAEQEAAWIESLRAEIEADGRSFRVGPNSLTSIPWEEFKEHYLGLILPEGVAPRPIIDDHGINDRDLPSRWDWREHGGVPGVRHQGNCGSCWCFAAAQTFESAIMIAEGFEVDISEQYVLSCNTGGSSCNGGWPDDAYDVWMSYGAIAEEDMPYEADDTIPCPGGTYPPIARISAVYSVGNTVSAIKNAIYYHGPVAATMNVYPDLVAYEGGCYEHDCIYDLNHVIALVGWDDSYCGGDGAWIMKNSWGDDWGVGGYAYMKYGTACVGAYTDYVDYLAIAHLLGINHEPLEDTENTTAPYEVVAEIISTGGSVDLGSSYLAYRVNMGAWVQVPFEPVGGQDECRALIPAQPAGTKVDYYLHAEDTVGNTKTVPMWAPEDTHVFVIGAFEDIIFEDFEEESGWTAGVPGDNATGGVWERADPEATSSSGWGVQPEDDHTPSPGRYCFVTDGRAGSSAGTYDVDGGHTTLLSPVYDLSGYELVVVDYRRWYTNRRGSNPYDDIWEVSICSGGPEWVPIEYTFICRENWSHQVHILNDFVDLGPEVQLRFIAADEGGGSLVEALVDDFCLRGIPLGSTGLPDTREDPGPPAWALSLKAWPNPATSDARISFYLPRAGMANLRVLDLTGRQMRLLHGGPASAGWHHLAWDGRDSRLRFLPSGSYHLRLETDGGSAAQGVLLLR